ncbi:MAG: hypothetical protein RIF39_03495 [Cyclobacteriaceae bacterium]
METYYPILYLIVSFAIAVVSSLLAYKLINSKTTLESRLTGIWVNESQTMRILLHHIDSIFQGEVVWINSIKTNQQHMLGAKMIKQLVLKTVVQGSTGIYIDPKTGQELPFRMWFHGKGRVKLAVIGKVDGKDKVVKEERWFQL